MNLTSFFPVVLRRSYNSGLKDGGEEPGVTACRTFVGPLYRLNKC